MASEKFDCNKTFPGDYFGGAHFGIFWRTTFFCVKCDKEVMPGEETLQDTYCPYCFNILIDSFLKETYYTQGVSL